MKLFSGSVVLFLFCFLSTSWALKCIDCDDCEDMRIKESKTCDDGEKCAKFTMKYPSIDFTMVKKDCFSDMVSCDSVKSIMSSLILNELKNRGIVSGDFGSMTLDCDYCTSDNCNGSSNVANSLLFTGSCLIGAFLMKYILH